VKAVLRCGRMAASCWDCVQSVSPDVDGCDDVDCCKSLMNWSASLSVRVSLVPNCLGLILRKHSAQFTTVQLMLSTCWNLHNNRRASVMFQ